MIAYVLLDGVSSSRSALASDHERAQPGTGTPIVDADRSGSPTSGRPLDQILDFGGKHAHHQTIIRRRGRSYSRPRSSK